MGHPHVHRIEERRAVNRAAGFATAFHAEGGPHRTAGRPPAVGSQRAARSILTGENPSFDAFKTRKIGVQLAILADYFLMRYENGSLVPNIAHHVKPEVGHCTNWEFCPLQRCNSFTLA